MIGQTPDYIRRLWVRIPLLLLFFFNNYEHSVAKIYNSIMQRRIKHMNIRSFKNLIFSVVGTALTVIVSHIAIDQYNDYKERKRLGLTWKQYRKLKKTFG